MFVTEYEVSVGIVIEPELVPAFLSSLEVEDGMVVADEVCVWGLPARPFSKPKSSRAEVSPVTPNWCAAMFLGASARDEFTRPERQTRVRRRIVVTVE